MCKTLKSFEQHLSVSLSCFDLESPHNSFEHPISARFDADFSFSQTANITSTFDASAFRFDSSLTDMGLTFDNTAT